MADLTVYAEALIATVARAFYDDDAICLIDVLLRDKFLRDDDMAPRLSLPAKRLRATLQFLTEEHLVRSETVDDLAQGGSQTTKFYYIDYNRAVHSIRLRLATLRQRLEADEMRARSSSFYLCPGYKLRRCNGRYTEQEAQQKLDLSTGLFLCRECYTNFENDPMPPPLETYTLKLVDNEKDLREAVDNLRRFNIQLSAKFIGSQQLRPGIYDLMQKVRGKQTSSSITATGGNSSTPSSSSSNFTKKPITSNLPSENFALGIGSTRLAGTGRTAGIKITKLQKQGLAESAAQAKNYLVGAIMDSNSAVSLPGGGGALDAGGGTRGWNETALMFLKSAHGHEIQFTVTRGGGARAQVLATGRANTTKTRRSRRKLLDAAASRVGSSLPFPLRVKETLKRQQEELQALAAAMSADAENAGNGKRQKTTNSKNGMHRPLYFLEDNIGRAPHEYTLAEMSYMAAMQQASMEKDAADPAACPNTDDDAITNRNSGGKKNGHSDDNSSSLSSPSSSSLTLILDEETEARQKSSPEERIVAFQQMYKAEMKRQEQMLHLSEHENNDSNDNNNYNISSGSNSNNNDAAAKKKKMQSNSSVVGILPSSPSHHFDSSLKPVLVENDDDDDDGCDDVDDIMSIIAWEDGDLWFLDDTSLVWHKI